MKLAPLLEPFNIFIARHRVSPVCSERSHIDGQYVLLCDMFVRHESGVVGMRPHLMYRVVIRITTHVKLADMPYALSELVGCEFVVEARYLCAMHVRCELAGTSISWKRVWKSDVH